MAGNRRLSEQAILGRCLVCDQLVFPGGVLFQGAVDRAFYHAQCALRASVEMTAAAERALEREPIAVGYEGGV